MLKASMFIAMVTAPRFKRCAPAMQATKAASCLPAFQSQNKETRRPHLALLGTRAWKTSCLGVAGPGD